MAALERQMTSIRYFSVLIFAIAISACGTSAIDQCNEAQTRSCTVIEGSCGAYYDAVDNLARSKTDCGAQADAYESCAVEQDACGIDAACGSQENRLTSCVGPYCLSNSSDPDCVYIRDHT